MSLFDTLVVQPLFNIILAIYALLPGHDFGVSIILFAVLVRVVLWPLIKKQLHQTKVMRAVQPELKKIKLKAKGNRALEGQLMLELYRERGINPFSSIGVLLLQLPIFIALFRITQILATDRERIGDYVYSFMQVLEPIKKIAENPDMLNESLFGLIDLTQKAVQNGAALYIPLVILALLSAVLQYYQSKQLAPVASESKKLKDLFKASAEGEKIDQSEVSAIMSRRMLAIFPFIP